MGTLVVKLGLFVLCATFALYFVHKGMTERLAYTLRSFSVCGSGIEMNPSAGATERAARSTVLVTGGMGNIGKYIVRDLLWQGFSVIALDLVDNTEELRELLEESEAFAKRSQFQYVKADIRNGTLLQYILGVQNVTGIIHLAAISRLATCLGDEAECHSVNAEGTRIIVDSVKSYLKGTEGRASRPWIIFSSSREIYGESCDLETPCDETSEPDPINLYGATKLKGEIHLKEGLDSFVGVIILRLSSVYGGRYDLPGRLIPTLAVKAMSNGLIDLMSSAAIFDFVHITDVVAAMMHAVSLLKSQRGYVNDFLVCSGQSSTSGQVLAYAQSIAQGRPLIRMLPQDERFPKHFVCNNTKMRGILGRTPRCQDLGKGLATYMYGIYKRDIDLLQEKIVEDCTQLPALDIVKFDECRVAILGLDPEHLARVPRARHIISSMTGGDAVLHRYKGSEFLFTLQEQSRKALIVDGATAVFLALPQSSSRFVKLRIYTENMSEMPSISNGKLNDEGYEIAAPVSILSYECPSELAHKTRVSVTDLEAAVTLLSTNWSPVRIPYTSDLGPACMSLHEALDVASRGLVACASLLQEDTSFNGTHVSAELDKGNAYSNPDKYSCNNHCPLSDGCVVTKGCHCAQRFCGSATSARPPSVVTPGKSVLLHTSLAGAGTRRISTRNTPDIGDSEDQIRLRALLTPTAAAYHKIWKPPKLHVFENDLEVSGAGLSTDKITTVTYDQGYASTPDMLHTALKELNVPLNESEVVYVARDPQFRSGFFTTVKDSAIIMRSWAGALEAEDDENHQKALDLRRKSSILRPFEDMTSNDHRPEVDLIIPSMSCSVYQLQRKEVQPFAQRRHFVFLWATREVTADSVARAASVTAGLFRKTRGRLLIQAPIGRDHLAASNDSIFCLHIVRATGWASRLQESILSGCIPVLSSDITHLPFVDVLNWEAFAVFVDAHNVQQLEDVLLSITEEELQEKHESLTRARHFLMFDETATSEESSGQKLGPLFLTLLSLRLRLAMQQSQP